MAHSSLIRRIFANLVLPAILLALLGGYLIVVTDLPGQVYTAMQRSFVESNSRRAVTQMAATWNVTVLKGDAVVPASGTWRDSRVEATLAARYEEQAGVSATVYDLDFYSEYRVACPSQVPTTTVELVFPFPAGLQTLHDVQFLVDGVEPPDARYSLQGITWKTELAAGNERRVEIRYRADGAGSFAYGLVHGQRADLNVTINVHGLTGSQVAQGALPATGREASGDGEVFTWRYTGLIPSRDVRLELPARLGFAQRVARLQRDFRSLGLLAPLLVGLFLVALAAALNLRGVHLTLEAYLLSGIGMALFYPLLTFLSGLVDIAVAGPLAFLAVGGLLLFFLGLAAGWRRTWLPVSLLVVVFLGVFSLGMLTPWRGLLLSFGGLLVLGGLMVSYARRPVTVEGAPQPEEEPVEAPKGRFCPRCGSALGEGFAFCPGCGHDARGFRTCAACGRQQYVWATPEAAHCIHCGELLG